MKTIQKCIESDGAPNVRTDKRYHESDVDIHMIASEVYLGKI